MNNGSLTRRRRRRRDLEDNLKRLVDAGLTWDSVRADFKFLKHECEAAFDMASAEPKVESREEQVSRCAVPYDEPPRHVPPGEEAKKAPFWGASIMRSVSNTTAVARSSQARLRLSPSP